eukprot:3420039-Amphidinium_carterae.1
MLPDLVIIKVPNAFQGCVVRGTLLCMMHASSILKAAWSVFELTMSGCWPNYSSVLIHDVSS